MWIKCQILFGICCQFHFNFHFGLFSAHNFWEFSSRYTLPLSAKGSCTWFDIVRFQGWHGKSPIEMSGCICLNFEFYLSIFWFVFVYIFICICLYFELYLSSCTWFDIVTSIFWFVFVYILNCICLPATDLTCQAANWNVT